MPLLMHFVPFYTNYFTIFSFQGAIFKYIQKLEVLPRHNLCLLTYEPLMVYSKFQSTNYRAIFLKP